MATVDEYPIVFFLSADDPELVSLVSDDSEDNVEGQSRPSLEVKAAGELKRRLLRRVEELGARLPANALDELVDRLGGSECVAEMTGRKGRVVHEAGTGGGGVVVYESRAEVDESADELNVREKERFMAGEKDVAIISEAASSGISLQVPSEFHLVAVDHLSSSLLRNRLDAIEAVPIVHNLT